MIRGKFASSVNVGNEVSYNYLHAKGLDKNLAWNDFPRKFKKQTTKKNILIEHDVIVSECE